MFPTMLRSTAQGVCFAIVRVSLGVFSFFVPMLNAMGFGKLAVILTGFLIVSGVIGWIWAPRNEGKTLDQLGIEHG
jgi:inositol transporter-like SP family MFS transporter